MAIKRSFAGPSAGSILTPSGIKNDNTWELLRHSTRQDGLQQYLPELYEQRSTEIWNRTISGFLSQNGSAEMPMSSDQVIWSEQGRLHLSYNGTINLLQV